MDLRPQSLDARTNRSTIKYQTLSQRVWRARDYHGCLLAYINDSMGFGGGVLNSLRFGKSSTAYTTCQWRDEVKSNSIPDYTK